MSRITLKENQKYYTEYADEAYHVLSGSVQVYIARWYRAEDKHLQESGQLVRLMEVNAGMQDRLQIPSLAYTDHDGQAWRLCLQGEAELEIRPKPTMVLLKNFLRKAGVGEDVFENEGGFEHHGYEKSLISLYYSEVARQADIIHRGEMNRKQLAAQTQEKLVQTLQPDQQTHKMCKAYLLLKMAVEKCHGTCGFTEEEIQQQTEKRDWSAASLAEKTGMIVQKTTLKDKWYRKNTKVFFAELKSEACTPVLCYPSGFSMLLFDGEGPGKRINAAVAETIFNEVYELTCPLPEGSLSLMDVDAYCRNNTPKTVLWITVAVSVLATVGGLFLPWMYYKTFSAVQNGDIPQSRVFFIAIGWLAVYAVLLVSGGILQQHIPEKLGAMLQKTVYHRLFLLPSSFYRKMRDVSLTGMVYNIGRYIRMMAQSQLQLLTSSVSGLMACAGLFALDWRMACAAAGILLASVLLERKLSKNTAVNQEEKAEDRTYELLSGVEKLRMAGAEEQAVQDYLSPRFQASQRAVQTLKGRTMRDFVISSSCGLVTIIIAALAIAGTVPLGRLITFGVVFGILNHAVCEAERGFRQYTAARRKLAATREFWAAMPQESKKGESAGQITGEITAEHVSFAYDQAAPVLKDVSMKIKAGEYVAIVGPSGCGKTTLMKLLLGFEKPDSGQIYYDGINLQAFNARELRRKMGAVLQDDTLIPGSIYENIILTGDARPDNAKVRRVVDEVGLREEIGKMPMGIHTILGETASTISGGQKQRILIARALYRDPKVLLLDEATSALDNHTQACVCDRIAQRNITRIVIAHRLSTVKKCDRIIVMDHGCISEQGNYESLMAQKGLFWQMASKQMLIQGE